MIWLTEQIIYNQNKASYTQNYLLVCTYFNHCSLDSHNVSIVPLCELYVYKGLDITVRCTKDLQLPTPTLKWKHTRVIPMDHINHYLTMIKITNPLSHHIYMALKEYGALGASFDCTSTKIRDSNPHIQNVDIVTAFDTLIKHDPPLIYLVGFNHLRYTVAEHVHHWLLKGTKKDTYLDPIIWCDISGSIVHPVLDGCCEVVMSHITKRPGIQYVRVFNSFERHILII